MEAPQAWGWKLECGYWFECLQCGQRKFRSQRTLTGVPDQVVPHKFIYYGRITLAYSWWTDNCKEKGAKRYCERCRLDYLERAAFGVKWEEIKAYKCLEEEVFHPEPLDIWNFYDDPPLAEALTPVFVFLDTAHGGGQGSRFSSSGSDTEIQGPIYSPLTWPFYDPALAVRYAQAPRLGGFHGDPPPTASANVQMDYIHYSGNMIWDPQRGGWRLPYDED